MRLLTTDGPVPRLEEFTGPYQAPPYAILSHRWEGKEITYQDLLRPSFDTAAEDFAAQGKTRSWNKIQNCRRVARELDFTHVWIDTCSIDKTSSAELSECINSMYTWYEGSALCVAYLSDVKSEHELEQSEWFSRGWCLQELLAPSQLAFYSQKWRFEGTRSSHATEVWRRTRIPQSILKSPSRAALSEKSVACRLSWAAHRRTLRPEDQAYSLLGLFDIAMPILYGEGEARALWRLQSEIYRITSDQSIFAWESPKIAPSVDLFSISLYYFQACGSVASGSVGRTSSGHLRADHQSGSRKIDWHHSSAVHGLRIQLQILADEQAEEISQYAVDPWKGICLLSCHDIVNERQEPVHIEVTVTQPGRLRRTTAFRRRGLPPESDKYSLLQGDFYFTPPVTDRGLQVRDPLYWGAEQMTVVIHDRSAIKKSFERSANPNIIIETPAACQAVLPIPTPPSASLRYNVALGIPNTSCHLIIALARHDTDNNILHAVKVFTGISELDDPSAQHETIWDDESVVTAGEKTFTIWLTTGCMVMLTHDFREGTLRKPKSQEVHENWALHITLRVLG